MHTLIFVAKMFMDTAKILVAAMPAFIFMTKMFVNTAKILVRRTPFGVAAIAAFIL